MKSLDSNANFIVNEFERQLHKTEMHLSKSDTNTNNNNTDNTNNNNNHSGEFVPTCDEDYADDLRDFVPSPVNKKLQQQHLQKVAQLDPVEPLDVIIAGDPQHTTADVHDDAVD
jgi:hypothetical protein